MSTNKTIRTSKSDSLSNNIASSVSKLRRLQIQENVIAKSILSNPLHNDENSNTNLTAKKNEKTHNSLNSFIEIRNLFQEVKLNLSTKNADIDEIKKDILNLEKQIKIQKTILESTLESLKKIENDIILQLQENPVNMDIGTDSKIRKVKVFDDIVPSPVKNIIKSPLKSLEIQEFQDFISSHKRHGGWIEYHHNTFVRIWNKHFQNEPDLLIKSDIFESTEFKSFARDAIRNIQGLNLEAINEHSKWYLNYLTLKDRQQSALNQWKQKKNILMQSQFGFDGEKHRISKKRCDSLRHYESCTKTVSGVCTPDFCFSPNSLEFSKSSTKSEQGVPFENVGYMRPTKQWASRCNTLDDLNTWNQIHGCNDTGKLKVPLWRSTQVD